MTGQGILETCMKYCENDARGKSYKANFNSGSLAYINSSDESFCEKDIHLAAKNTRLY